jgi:hypothetical protein
MPLPLHETSIGVVQVLGHRAFRTCPCLTCAQWILRKPEQERRTFVAHRGRIRGISCQRT